MYYFFITTLLPLHEQFVPNPEIGFTTAEQVRCNRATPVTPDKLPI